MAHRVRNHAREAPAASSSVGSQSNSGSNNQVPGKRKRDVLQDISEEHSGNGSAHQQTTASSGRRALAPRRPSPMAPARRASVRVRRSRRLSEQQPSTNGRGGNRAGTAGVAGNAGGSGCARGRGAGAGVGGACSGGEDDEGGMSCDEDLEGMVVDLSFEGVADDSVWREPDRSKDAALAGGIHSERREKREVGSKRSNKDGGGGGGVEVESNSTNSSSVTRTGAGDRRGRGGRNHPSAAVSGRGSAESSSSSDASSVRGASFSNPSGSNTGGSSLETQDERDLDNGRRCGGADRAPLGIPAVEDEVTATGVVRGAQREARGQGREYDLERQVAPKGLSPSKSSSRSSDRGQNASVGSQPTLSLRSGEAPHPQASPASPAVLKDAYCHGRERNAAAAVACARTPLPAGVEDIDAGVADEAESHLRNPDYVVEHAAFLRKQERRNRPEAYIGGKQRDMRQSMRSVLVDWIVEVCDQFKLSARTLFQVVELIDRSLTAFEVPRGRLQLLGCACVVLASKYEEIYAPTAEELAHISDNTYTRAEIITMELTVVNALQFRLTCVTPCCFVDRFCRAAGSNARERSLVNYLLELLLQDYQGVSLLPSLKAAAALYLARQTLHPRGCPRVAWTRQTEFYTGYGARALESCVRRLHALHTRSEGHNLHAVRDKYKRSQLHRVAEVTCALEEVLDFGSGED